MQKASKRKREVFFSSPVSFKKGESMKTVSFRHVHLKDPILSKIQQLVSDFVIDYQWKIFNGEFGGEVYSPSLDNFRIIAGDKKGSFSGNPFQGGDLAKWLEGACIKLQNNRDAVLEKRVNEVIDVLRRAQQPDGYLGAYYQLKEPGKQFSALWKSHELFFFGHLAEAAIAHHAATGKTSLLEVIERFTSLIDQTFGIDKFEQFDGHPEVEMALMRLYEYTGEKRYLRLAKFFIDVYGNRPSCFGENNVQLSSWNGNDVESALAYMMADKPVREASDIHGHAVRAVYLAAGMADVARETGDADLRQACQRLWESCTGYKQYISGGIGSTRHGEAFGCDYDLPNDRTYQETCAGIGMVYFAFAMLRLAPKAEYADMIERCIYNCILSALSFDGTRFFYVNPLETWPPVHGTDPDFDSVKPVRQKWYKTACCPPNLARFLPTIGGYCCTITNQNLYLHQYMAYEAKLNWQGKDIDLTMEGDYPWQGNIKIRLKIVQPLSGTIFLRIPSWCRGCFTVSVNDESWMASCIDGYLPIKRTWQSGDCISLDLDMTPTAWMAHPQVMADAGKVAIMRGPVLYCAEEMDNGNLLHQLKIMPEQGFDIEQVNICGHVMPGIMAHGVRMNAQWADTGILYSRYSRDEIPCKIHLIPYYAWGNRDQDQPREMRVWLHV